MSVHYDPMLAKLIVWAESRDAARRRADHGASRICRPRHPDEHSVPASRCWSILQFVTCLDRYRLSRSRGRDAGEGHTSRPAGTGTRRTGTSPRTRNPTEPGPWNPWNLWHPWNPWSRSVRDTEGVGVSEVRALGGGWYLVRDGERQTRVAVAV